MRQCLAALLEHLEGELVTGAMRQIPGHARPLPTGLVRRPFLWKEQTCINQSVFFPRHVSHEDADLAVVNLAVSAAPLAGHADTLDPLLEEGRGIEDDHAVGLAEF